MAGFRLWPVAPRNSCSGHRTLDEFQAGVALAASSVASRFHGRIVLGTGLLAG